MSTQPLNVIQAENSRPDVKVLWNTMPDKDKAYYNNDINVYIHHKIAQLIKDEAYDTTTEEKGI